MASSDRVLVYDGDCSLCARLSRLAMRRWLVGDARREPHDAFDGETAARLEAAGLRNELAVLDEGTGEIRSGYDGIVWLLGGGRLPWLAALLSVPPVRWLLRHDYRLVAYNRRIFAPPDRGVACACDPDLHVGYRWTFVLVALLWTGLIASWAGSRFGTELPFFHKTAPPGAWAGSGWWGLAVVAGWSVLAPLALRLPSPRGLDLLGHLAWILAAMAVPLLLALVAWILGVVFTAFPDGGWLPQGWLFRAGVPLVFGAVAWGAALPIAVLASLRRLPRLGLSRPLAGLSGLVLWGLPVALLAPFARLPSVPW